MPSPTSSSRFAIVLAAAAVCLGCSVIVDSELANKSGSDAGPSGMPCTTTEQCITLEPTNCMQACVGGFCTGGTEAPNGTRCGEANLRHCVAGFCVVRECGDGYVDPLATPREYCDDGNRVDSDGCNNNCTRSCAPPAPANCDDRNVCNGMETCMTIAAGAFCRPAELAADGTTCMVGTTPGMCSTGVCSPLED